MSQPLACWIIGLLLSGAAWAEYTAAPSLPFPNKIGSTSSINLRIGTQVEVISTQGEWAQVFSPLFGEGWLEQRWLKAEAPTLASIQADDAALPEQDWSGHLLQARRATELRPLEPWGWQKQLQAAQALQNSQLAIEASNALQLLRGEALSSDKPATLLALVLKPEKAYNASQSKPDSVVIEWQDGISPSPSSFHILHDLQGQRLGLAADDLQESNECGFTTTYGRYRLQPGQQLHDIMLLSDTPLTPRKPDTSKLSPAIERNLRKQTLAAMVAAGMPKKIAVQASLGQLENTNEGIEITPLDFDHNGQPDALISAYFYLTIPAHEANAAPEWPQSFSIVLLAQNRGHNRFELHRLQWQTGHAAEDPNSPYDEHATHFHYLTHLDLAGHQHDAILTVAEASLGSYHALFQYQANTQTWQKIDFEFKGCD